jgi:hypothetical protein
MKNFDVDAFVKDLDKLFNDMQNKAIAGSANVATAAWVIKQQREEIKYWEEKFNTAMDLHDTKPAKYTDEWWKEVAEFNKQLKAQEK